MLSRSEEDHLKAVYSLLQEGADAFTNDVAARLRTKPSSVTVMLKKLADKGLLKHQPYRGVRLTAKGRGLALMLVRKHRLWETFLVDRLGFAWDEVHDVAEQLEHISSEKLVDRLDHYLGHPAFDPHGDPIPDRDGHLPERPTLHLADCAVGDTVRLVAVKDPSDELLHLLGGKGIGIGARLKLVARHAFDGSFELHTAPRTTHTLSAQVAAHLLVERP